MRDAAAPAEADDQGHAMAREQALGVGGSVPLREPNDARDAEPRGHERARDDQDGEDYEGLERAFVPCVNCQPDDAGEQQQKWIRAPVDTARWHRQRHAHAAKSALAQRVFEGWEWAVGPTGEDEHCKFVVSHAANCALPDCESSQLVRGPLEFDFSALLCLRAAQEPPNYFSELAVYEDTRAP